MRLSLSILAVVCLTAGLSCTQEFQGQSDGPLYFTEMGIPARWAWRTW